MTQHRLGDEPEAIAGRPYALGDLDIAAGGEAPADAVGEEGPFDPTAFAQRRPAHDHPRADEAAGLANLGPELLLGEAEAELVDKLRRRLLPIEHDAAADAARIGVRPDCVSDCRQPARLEHIVVVDKSDPRRAGFADAPPPGRGEALLLLHDASQSGQDPASSVRLDDLCRAIGAVVVDDENRPFDTAVDRLARQSREDLVEIGRMVIGADSTSAVLRWSARSETVGTPRGRFSVLPGLFKQCAATPRRFSTLSLR
jgi:hypothetical protein